MNTTTATTTNKLHGLKAGDRVRVTFEGEVTRSSEYQEIFVHLDGVSRSGPRVFLSEEIAAPTFHIERIEKPLSVGDRVRGAGPWRRESKGVLIAVHNDSCWVEWSAGPYSNPGMETCRITDLERIP